MSYQDQKPAGDLPSVANDVGGGIYLPKQLEKSFPRDIMLNRIIYCKAIRRVGTYLDLPLKDMDITALAVLYSWSVITSKDGGPLNRVVDWSGYKPKWLSWIRSGMENCLRLELIANVPVNGGNRLIITVKGERVIEVMRQMEEKVIGEMMEQYQAGQTREETALIKRARIKRARMLGKVA